MKTLPVCIFTHNRTSCALATIDALLRNLRCGRRKIKWILCDDRSEPGHVKALVRRFNEAGVEPSVHLNDDGRTGLGASMNKGLEEAFGMAHECLRLEDDWLLKRPLDLEEWADGMDAKSVCSVRLGMMFRKDHELRPFEMGLLRVKSDRGRTYTFNNQVALVSDVVYDLVGGYMENAEPQTTEKDMALKYVKLTDYENLTPYVCWPRDWERNQWYGERMAFDHIGKSTLGHKYQIPGKYMQLNDPEADRRIRAKFV